MTRSKRQRRLGYWTRYPERRRAAWRVWRARRDGRLARRACWSCGDPHTEAHHPLGYRGIAALLVVWLCLRCHNAAHGRGVVEGREAGA